MNDFAEWLHQQLNERGWNQSELAKEARKRGYIVVPPQISRILNREQEAGISAVIAIAHGLGLSRETVFRARGWLPALSTSNPLLVSDPLVQEVAQKLLEMPIAQRESACTGFLMLISSK